MATIETNTTERWGPPEALVERLRLEWDVATFVETGTYQGDTALWASAIFDAVITIELSPTLFRDAKAKLQHMHNVVMLEGDSGSLLNEIAPYCRGSKAIFWLDAHWFLDELDVAGRGCQCPLVAELQAINRLALESFIIIDDAHHFLSPFSRALNYEEWPTLPRVVSLLNEGPPRYVVMIQDCFVAVPQYAASVLKEYCLQVNEQHPALQR